MRDDGGPAFAYIPQANPGEWASGQTGMSVRQFYKGMAIMGQVTNLESSDKIASWAAELADAMIAEDREIGK